MCISIENQHTKQQSHLESIEFAAKTADKAAEQENISTLGQDLFMLWDIKASTITLVRLEC